MGTQTREMVLDDLIVAFNRLQLQLKLQAAMKGPSHPGSPPPTGIRKTVNSGRHACKRVNTGELWPSHFKVPRFLLPTGGALTVTEYCHVDVFRPGLSSNMWSLEQIGHCIPELQQLPVSWRTIRLCQAATETPFSENSRSAQCNISKAFRFDWPNMMLIWLKF